MTAFIVSADLDLRVVALSIYITIAICMVATVLIVKAADHRKQGNAAYRDRVQTVLDEALPREDAAAKWAAYREGERQ